MSKSTEKRIKEQQKKTQDDMVKAQEALEEKTVVTAREKIAPLLKEANLGVDETKVILQILENTLTQSVYQLMNKNTVEGLKITDGMNEDYPNSALYKGILEAVKDETIGFGIGLFRWINGKIDKDVKDLHKDKKLSDVLQDF
jgi:hypothetical protein